jgi:hypothetical protein
MLFFFCTYPSNNPPDSAKEAKVVAFTLLIALSLIFFMPPTAHAEICAAGPIVCAAMFAPLIYLVWLLIPKGNTQKPNNLEHEEQLSGTSGILYSTPKDSFLRYDMEDNKHMVLYYSYDIKF